MSQLAGRESEISILNQLVKSDKAEFLALYGRRRVGKTYLIRTYFKDRDDSLYFDVAGTQKAPMKEQIANFTQRMGEVFYAAAQLVQEKNWNLTFKALTNAIASQPKDKKIILFFDEFPWMSTKNSRLLQSLDYFWNQYWSKDSRIKLIICGSSASWIINKIINNKAGLHNRITQKIRLQSFNLSQTKEYLHGQKIKLNESHIVQLYFVTGGVPYYLANLKPGKSAAQYIDELAFDSKGLLWNEFDNLFSALFENYEIHVEIIRKLASSPRGVLKETLLTSIAQNMKGKKGLGVLQDLEDAGFIKQFKSFGKKKKGHYYRIIDEYTLFYLKWIEPIKNSLLGETIESGYWQLQQKLPGWHSWSGCAFEMLCYKHILQIRRGLGLLTADVPYTWQYIPKNHSEDQGAQIDLLFDCHDDTIRLCEIKYTVDRFVVNKSVVEGLLKKKMIFEKQTKTTKQIFICMVASAGLANNFYAEDLISSVVTMGDLFVE